MWSQSYQRAWEDIFAIQDEIAKAVADNLKVILIDDGSRTLVKPLTDNREAYEWYLRGRYMLSQRSDGAEKSAQFFREALRRDSSFTAAYAGLGHAYLWLGWGNYRPSHIAFDSARHYAREALRRDSLSSYAHYIHGAVHLWYDWDWDKARAALEKALSLNTAEASAYLDRGWLHAVGGDFSAAIEQMRKAVELDPLNLEFNLDMADLHRMARQYPQALEIAKAMLEVYPDNSDAHWMVGMIEFTRRNYAEALPHFRRAVLLSQDDDWSRIHLAMALVKAPETRAEGVALLQELTNQKDLDTQAPVELALAFASLGDRNKALDLLELSYQLHANWLISLKIEPLWDELRQENRFRALSRRMRFPNPR
jgi:tetratricopeptide (TPR) repeat protein